MNCTVAYPQDEGAVLMLGYGERSSPCRQRPSLHLRIISRSLTWRILQKVISRPKDCFGGWILRGFAAVFADGFPCNTRTSSPTGENYD
jgi:hypothetical protein